MQACKGFGPSDPQKRESNESTFQRRISCPDPISPFSREDLERLEQSNRKTEEIFSKTVYSDPSNNEVPGRHGFLNRTYTSQSMPVQTFNKIHDDAPFSKRRNPEHLDGGLLEIYYPRSWLSSEPRETRRPHSLTKSAPTITITSTSEEETPSIKSNSYRSSLSDENSLLESRSDPELSGSSYSESPLGTPEKRTKAPPIVEEADVSLPENELFVMGPDGERRTRPKTMRQLVFQDGTL